MYLIISTSLTPNSRSRILAQLALTVFNEKEVGAEFFDLRDIDLPFCDGDKCYDDPTVKKLKEIIKQADSIIVASPIYNYDVNAVAKNLLEVTGSSWNEKVVGFICSAGGKGSYMSVMPFANSLMLDYRCRIIPRYVYTTSKSFNEGQLADNEIIDRINELVDTIITWSSS